MSTERPPSILGPATLGVVGTLSVILPAFLTGAMAVQIRDDLEMSESGIGLAIGFFFVGSACGSMALGSLAERLGPRLAIRLGLLTTIIVDVGIAGITVGPRSLIGLLVIAGLANALTQPAINLLLVRAVAQDRLGFVMALKQSGMPGAALFGGLAVPVVALTVGWRAGYVVAAGLALAALGLTRSADGEEVGAGEEPLHRFAGSEPGSATRPTPAARPSGPARPELGWPMLLLMAAVGVLGGGAANILVGYLVSGAVAAGVAPGPAGLLLTLGSGLGILSRLFHGWAADRGHFDVLTRVVALFVVGSIGGAGLAVGTPTAYLLATPLAFAAGWAWPGLFNLVVVNANRSAPAAATGVTQTGVYIGSLIGPMVAGLLIERSGYGAAWILVSACLAGAALLAAAVRSGMAPVDTGDTVDTLDTGDTDDTVDTGDTGDDRAASGGVGRIQSVGSDGGVAGQPARNTGSNG